MAQQSNVIVFRVVDGHSDNPADRRGAPRRRVLKTGKTAYYGGYCVVECSVRDMSDTGARLRAQNEAAIPDTFKLILDSEGLEADCEVVWRKEADIGVRFIGAPRRVEPARPQVIAEYEPRKKRSIFKRRPKLG